MVYLHEYLYATEKGFTFDFDENVNVEHIMPASGRNKHQIREDATIEDGKEFDNLVNKIGNKMLLEEDINKSIGNDWFRTKKQNSVKEKSGYKDSKYAIAIALSNYHKDNWTKEDIEIATNGATERIMKYIFG